MAAPSSCSDASPDTPYRRGRRTAHQTTATLRDMSNAAGAQASREEEIALLAMEEVLGVEIQLADAGAGNKMPDGTWVYPDGEGRRGIVEITSPPAASLMSEWAAAKREGRPQTEGGSVSARLGELAQVCTDILAEDWAQENLDELLAQPADERHLFLFARGHDVGGYFDRLSDSYEDAPAEHVEDLVLPVGISDVWFRGRASRDRQDRQGSSGVWFRGRASRDRQDRQGSSGVWLARFQAGVGWRRYVVSMEEQQLPSPNRGIADDSVPEGWRQPKDRSVTPAGR
jgi:hypothetical protein